MSVLRTLQFFGGTCSQFCPTHIALTALTKKNAHEKQDNVYKMLYRPSWSFKATSALSPLSTINNATSPTHSLLMPASMTTKSQGRRGHLYPTQPKWPTLHHRLQQPKVAKAWVQLHALPAQNASSNLGHGSFCHLSLQLQIYAHHWPQMFREIGQRAHKSSKSPLRHHEYVWFWHNLQKK